MSYSTIICEDFNPEIYTELPHSLEGHVDIWQMSISSYLPYLEQLTLILDDEEIDKSNKYHQLKDSQGFIVRHGILRLLLSRYMKTHPRDIRFTLGENKKPVISSSDSSIHYNTSHSQDRILLAFSTAEVGVDVEFVKEEFEYTDVLEHSFSSIEIASIENNLDSRKEFFKLWTRKEALLKACTKGLDDDLASIPSLDGTHQISSELLGSTTDWTVSTLVEVSPYKTSVAHLSGLKSRIIESHKDYILSGI